MEELPGVEWRQALRRLWLVALAAVFAGVAQAQTVAQTVAPQLSPQAAYDQATRPMEIVHRSVANWSDTEVQSLAVAMANAAKECAARKVTDYDDDTLIAFGRLCSLGQQWPVVQAIGTRYIESKSALKPQLALAYGLKLEAMLHMQDERGMVATATAMLANNPYEGTVDTAMNEVLEYLQLAYTDDALRLYGLREPLVLAAMPAGKLPLHTLYADAQAKAMLEQYAGKPEAAATTIREADQALAAVAADPGAGVPHAQVADELLLVARSRRQYALLGQPLPELRLGLSLKDRKPAAAIDAGQAAATALLLFPAWCAQCVRMTAADLGRAQAEMKRGAVQVFPLVALTPAELATLLAPAALPAKAGTPAPPLPPAAPLLGTATYAVPPETLETFVADDFPLLIVTDTNAKVRFLGVAPETGLRSGEFVDRVTDHVATQWPSRFVPVADTTKPVVQ